MTVTLSESCFSAEKAEYFAIFLVIIIFVNAVFTLTATLGNGMIIVAILRSQNLQTPSYLLITGLAFTDLLVGLVYHPLMIVMNVFRFHSHVLSICKMGLGYSSITILLGTVALMMVTCISIDRYLALTLRHRYRDIVTKRRVRFIMVIVWAIGFGLALLSTLFYIFSYGFVVDALGLFFTLACLITTSVFYVKSFRTLRLYTAQVQAQQPNSLQPSFNVVKYKQSLKTMLMIFEVCLVSFIPVVLSLLSFLLFGNRKEIRHFHVIAMTLFGLNSNLSPAIYLIRFKDVRRACKHLFRKNSEEIT